MSIIDRTLIAGRYQIERELGEGGQAHVFLARDLSRPAADGEAQARVALKVLKTDASHAESFRREFEALAALRHPNLISVLDFGTTDDGAPSSPASTSPASIS